MQSCSVQVAPSEVSSSIWTRAQTGSESTNVPSMSQSTAWSVMKEILRNSTDTLSAGRETTAARHPMHVGWAVR